MELCTKKKRLINSGGKDIKNDKEILELLEAVWAPKKLAVIHYSITNQGNQKTDQAQ
jgi:hypothetical protein